MINKGQFRKEKRTQKDYSLAFKLQVVDEVEKGELSQNQAQIKYGIQGNATILVWLRKHGRLDWSSKLTMSKKAVPNKKIKELEKKLQRLEAEKEILNRAIDIADEMFDTDIRKKYFEPVVAKYKQPAAGSRSRSVALVSSTLRYSRQYYYKHCKEKEHFLFQQQQVKQLIDKERKVLPRLGGKKLYHQIQPCLQGKGIKMGRDKLFKLLSYYDLLIKPKRRYIQTTMSKHWLRKYPNLIKEQAVTRPEQVWVSDITYIKTDQGNCYLNLVTDTYSRKIMGYAIADSMDTTNMKKAFEMAVNNRKYPTDPLIHHSDRGLQYCSQEYIQIAVENGIKISMTEQSDPYENALAERMNRTLKEEFGLGQRIKTKQQAFYLTKEAINIYNHYRPHLPLKMKTPNQVH